MSSSGAALAKGLAFINKSKQDSKSRYEQDLNVTCVRVMQYVGGYTEFMNLPLSAFIQVTKAIRRMDELQYEKEKAMFGRKR